MVPAGILYVRAGRRIYRRVGLTGTFRLEAVYASVGKAKRFCVNQPHGAAVRYEWLTEKLGFDNVKLEE